MKNTISEMLKKFIPLVRHNLIVTSIVVVALSTAIVTVSINAGKEQGSSALTTNHTTVAAAKKKAGSVEGASLSEKPTDQTAPTTPSTSKSTTTTPATTSTPAKPKSTIAPTPAKVPVKIQPLPPSTSTPKVTSITISAGAGLCSSGTGNLGYHYDLKFQDKTAGGTVNAQWEFVGGSNYNNMPNFPVLAFSSGTVEIYDDVAPSNGFSYKMSTYSARLHVTSPNDIYSNVITVTGCM